MRKGYLLWFFFFFFTLICSQLALYGLSLDKVHLLENKYPKVSEHIVVAREKQGTHSNGNVNPDTEGNGESTEAKDQTIDTEKAQRGRGSNGGANVVHKRPNEKAAASVLESPFGLFLLLVLPHLIA